MEDTRISKPVSRLGGHAELRIGIVGANIRAASILRLLNEVEDLAIVAVADPNPSAPGIRLAEELGIFATSDFEELYQVPGLDLIIDISEDYRIYQTLSEQRPAKVELLGSRGSQMVWDLLIAKKRGEEQEKLFVELQVAYDKIRSHERRLQASKEALERANEELEGRLAEIFFTHEFFKALTRNSSVHDVTNLIVDGANGILGAEVACVYLLEQSDWTLRLQACQGKDPNAFRARLPVSETILGQAFSSGLVQQASVIPEDPSAGWAIDPTGIRSQAALPLRAGDLIVGVLVVASAERRELSTSECERLAVIGNQSSLALQNALLHEELERLSVTDRLTELYNHGYFQQRLEEEIGRASRFHRKLSLIMLDIDDFKQFNDSYGHPRGDKVLQAVSAIIRDNLREVDVAARYGGEEFVVVLPETDADGAVAVAERIRSSVEEYAFVGSESLPPVTKTVSIGVATYPEQANTQSRLIDLADRAMYLAKRSGKNSVVLSDI